MPSCTPDMSCGPTDPIFSIRAFFIVRSWWLSAMDSVLSAEGMGVSNGGSPRGDEVSGATLTLRNLRAIELIVRIKQRCALPCCSPPKRGQFAPAPTRLAFLREPLSQTRVELLVHRGGRGKDRPNWHT